MASYCLRFSSVMSFTSHDVVEVQAPVFLPISSIILAARGIEECWNPADGMRDQIRTLRGFWGVAGGFSGSNPSVAIILVTSFGQASRGLLLRPPHASFKLPWPPRPAVAGGAAVPAPACCARAGGSAAASRITAETVPTAVRSLCSVHIKVPSSQRVGVACYPGEL